MDCAIVGESHRHKGKKRVCMRGLLGCLHLSPSPAKANPWLMIREKHVGENLGWTGEGGEGRVVRKAVPDVPGPPQSAKNTRGVSS